MSTKYVKFNVNNRELKITVVHLTTTIIYLIAGKNVHRDKKWIKNWTWSIKKETNKKTLTTTKQPQQL